MTVGRSASTPLSGNVFEAPAFTECDRAALAAHVHSPETTRRCRIVLLALQGWPDAVIAERVGVTLVVVRQWKESFARAGVAALVQPPGAARARGAGPT